LSRAEKRAILGATQVHEPEPRQINSEQIAPGRVLLGKYRIERIIGRGGMGTVVEARHLALDDRVALKFLLPQLAVIPDAVERFMREARAAIRIKNEHVARVMDVSALETGEPFLVLEYLEGRDLLHVVKAEGPLSVPEAVDTLLQACHALAEAHALGIIHRDIKPGNLFRARASDGGTIIKVLDFGLSKVVGSKGVNPLTRTQATMGSANYMAPEQMHSLRDVDHRADVYSLGVTLYVLLSGKHPYPGSSLPAVYAAILTGQPQPIRHYRPDVPEPLARAISKAYERDPASRYQSVGELAMALAPFAPPQSRATLDRISRLVARPHTEPLAMPGMPALPLPGLPAAGDGGPATPLGLTNAVTRLMPVRLPINHAPLMVAFGVLGTLALAAALFTWSRVRGSDDSATSNDATATAETAPAAPPPVESNAQAAAEPPAATAEPSTSAEASAASTASATATPKRPAPTKPPRPAPTTAATAAPAQAPVPAKPSPFDVR
jgi:serine/threonine-protein kinase